MSDNSAESAIVAKNDNMQRQSQYMEAITSGEWTPELMRVVRETVAKGADNAELAMFAHVCARTKLDPFTKQIHFTKRFDRRMGKEVAVIITGIDGFRVVANRSGKFRGVVGPVWCGKDGVWRDVWLEDSPPFAAKVGVRHADFDEPVFAIARWSASCPMRDGRPTGLWADRDAEQLAKCAEALALRMAFPNDLSGLYTSDEMAKAMEASSPARAQAVMSPAREIEAAKQRDAVNAAVEEKLAVEVIEEFPGESPFAAAKHGGGNNRKAVYELIEKTYAVNLSARGGSAKALSFISKLNERYALGLTKFSKVSDISEAEWGIIHDAAVKHEQLKLADNAHLDAGTGTSLSANNHEPGDGVQYEAADNPPTAHTPDSFIELCRKCEARYQECGTSRILLLPAGPTVWLVDSATLAELGESASKDVNEMAPEQLSSAARIVVGYYDSLEAKANRRK